MEKEAKAAHFRGEFPFNLDKLVGRPERVGYEASATRKNLFVGGEFCLQRAARSGGEVGLRLLRDGGISTG